MNQPTLKGKWNELKGKVKAKWGDLTDDDLKKVSGERDQLIGVIQQRYGTTRAEVERDLDEWERSMGLR